MTSAFRVLCLLLDRSGGGERSGSVARPGARRKEPCCFLHEKDRRADSGGIEDSRSEDARITLTTDSFLLVDLSEKTSETVYARSRSLQSES